MSRQPGTRTDLQTAIHNPGLLTREALTRSFVARKQILKTLEDELRASVSSTAGQQHRLFYGPRGMGKTTLLLRLQYLVEDDPELSRRWCPVTFLEERYSIGDLADFWLEVLKGLPPTRQERSPEQLAERLKTRHRDDGEQLANAAFQALKRWAQQEQKQLLFLIDNLNEVFDHIGNERQLHQLRAILMETPWLKLIGFSPTYFEQLDKSDAPFYEFFSVERLEVISLEETREILEHWSKLDERPDLLDRLAQRQGRIKNLHLLTGGNPRLVAVIYELVKDGPLNSTLEDVQKLVDRMTPYFKSQIDALPVQSRRLVDALAQRWEPTQTRALAEDLRQPSNQVSAQLNRLKRDGWVTQRGDGKNASYQLADRFYNIFHLVRHSRTQIQRLKGFVKFLQIFFEDEDLRRLADNIRDYLKALPVESNDERVAQIARFSMIAEATTDPNQKAQLYSEALQQARSLTGKTLQLDELVDLPQARQVLGEERISVEEKIRELEAERKVRALPFEKLQMLANLYIQTHEWTRVEACWRECLKKKANDASIAYGLASALLAQGKHDECMGVLSAIQSDDAGLQCACSNLKGVVLTSKGDFQAAETHYREALKQQWHAMVSTNLATILLNQGRELEARELLEENAEHRDADASQLLLLYRLSAKSKEKKVSAKAENYLRRAAEKDGFCGFVWSAYLRKHKHTTQAKKALKAAQEKLGTSTRPPQFYAQLLQALFQLEAWEEAEHLAQMQEKQDGDCKNLGRLHLVLLLAMTGKLVEADKKLKEAFDKGLGPHKAAWWGEQLGREGQHVLAKRCGWYAVRQDNDLPKGYLVLSAASYNLNQFRAAFDCAVKAQSLDSGIPWGHRMLALSSVRLGLWEEARNAAVLWSEKEPRELFARLVQYEACLRSSLPVVELEEKIRALITHVTDAINLSHQALTNGLPNACTLVAQLGTTLDKQNALSWNNYSAGLWATERCPEAVDAARQALAIDSLHTMAWRNYFRSAHSLKRTDLIEEGIQTLLSNPVLNLEQVNEVAAAFIELGMNEHVVVLAEGFRKRNVSAYEAHVIEAAAMIRIGNWEEAGLLLREVPPSAPNVSDVRRLLFLCACQMHDLNAARFLWNSMNQDGLLIQSLMEEIEALELELIDGWEGLSTFLLVHGDELFQEEMEILGYTLMLTIAPHRKRDRLTRLLTALKDANAQLETPSLPLSTWSSWCEAMVQALTPEPDESADSIDWEALLENTLFPLEVENAQATQDLWRLAASLLESHLPDASAWCWGEVLRLTPDDEEALAILARLAKSEGNRQKELTFLRRLMQREERSLEHGIAFADCLLALHHFDEAHVHLKQLRRHYPYSFKARLYHLVVLYNLSKADDAEQLFQQLVHEQPLDERPWIIRYQWLQARRALLVDRLRWLAEGLEQLPSSPFLTYAWAKEQLSPAPSSEQALQEIEQRIQRCFVKDPEHRLARELQTLLLLARGRWREALGVLDSMLQNPSTLESQEKPLMDLALLVGARGKPMDVAAVLKERELEERWQPLVLALELANDPTLASRARVPIEILKVAEELRDRLVEMRRV